MKSKRILKVLCGILLLLPIALLLGWKIKQASLPPVLFVGDFETGNLSQFGTEGLPEELQVVTSPVRAGRYALRARCLKSDFNVGGPDYRAEVKKVGAGGTSASTTA